MRSNCLAVIALSTVLFAAGCNKRVPTTALPPPAVTATPSPAAMALDQANRAFGSGNYDEAARSYESYLKLVPTGGSRDHALFHLGLAYALRPAPAGDWQRAASTFRQLMDDYPDSTFKAPANLILSLRAEVDQAAADSRQRDQRIRQLTTELDRLKKIDADRRRRP